MATISTHVLDTTVGRPAAGVVIALESEEGTVLGTGTTDADGRLPGIGPDDLPTGTYRLRFDTAGYHARRGVAGFFPEVVVTFITEQGGHYHVPLLLTAFGYTTYRGS